MNAKKTREVNTSRNKSGLVGLARVNITPGKGVNLAGYGLWQRPCAGVHDALYASCIVIEYKDTAVAMLSIPVCTLDAETTKIIRERVCKNIDIPEENILIHATHTHSAPYVEGEYRFFLYEKCVDCIKNAWKKRSPANIGIGSKKADECGRNRRYLDYGGFPVDPEVSVIKVTDLQGRLTGVVLNYACHATCLDARNTLVSNDWPFFAAAKIKRETHSSVKVLFFGGPSGDINPGYSAGLSAVGAEIPVRTWAEAERIGCRVGEAAAAVLAEIKTKPVRRLRSHSSILKLPLRSSYPVTLAAAKEELGKKKRTLSRLKKSGESSRVSVERAKADVFFAELVSEGAKQFYSGKLGEFVNAELQSVILNDSVITTFPGEVFVKAGIDVKRLSPLRKTIVIGLANTLEAKGYMPTREAFGEGDYEVYNTYYDKKAAGVLVKTTIRNINSAISGRKARAASSKSRR